MDESSINKPERKQQFRSCNRKVFHKKCFACDSTVCPLQRKRKQKVQKVTANVNLPVAILDTSKYSAEYLKETIQSQGTSGIDAEMKPDSCKEKASATAVITASVCKHVNRDVSSVGNPSIHQKHELEKETKSVSNNGNNMFCINDHSYLLKEDDCSVIYSKILSAHFNKPENVKIELNTHRCRRVIPRSRGGKFSNSFSIHPSFRNGVKKICCVLHPVPKKKITAPRNVAIFRPKSIDISHIVRSTNCTYEPNSVTRRRLVQYLHNLQKNGTVCTWDLFDSENSLIRECAYDAITLQVDEDLTKLYNLSRRR